jgi:hypothetical protein
MPVEVNFLFGLSGLPFRPHHVVHTRLIRLGPVKRPSAFQVQTDIDERFVRVQVYYYAQTPSFQSLSFGQLIEAGALSGQLQRATSSLIISL